jgi:hypothetical protein
MVVANFVQGELGEIAIVEMLDLPHAHGGLRGYGHSGQCAYGRKRLPLHRLTMRGTRRDRSRGAGHRRPADHDRRGPRF